MFRVITFLTIGIILGILLGLYIREYQSHIPPYGIAWSSGVICYDTTKTGYKTSDIILHEECHLLVWDDYEHFCDREDYYKTR